MRRARARAASLAAILLAATTVPAQARAKGDDWHQIIAQRDRTRLKNWRETWVSALADARARGFGGQVDAEGALLQPDAALDRPGAPDGLYHCRVVKLGTALSETAAPAPRAFSIAAPGHCRIGGGMLVRLDGAQRPGGRLFDYDGARTLFLGGLALGDEVGTVRYGRDPQRALVGFVERIGPARWRLVLPQPAWESRLDVMELVPDGG